MFIKYTNKKYATMMLEEGTVRLSTFWHFQADEKPEIGDPDEGQSGVVFHNDTLKEWTLEPELLDAAAMSVEGRSRFSEPKFLKPGQTSWIEAAGGFNTFMYSVTQAEAPSTTLMKRLGYDTAVEIKGFQSFVQHTGVTLRQHHIKTFGFDQKGFTRVRCISNKVRYVDSKRRTITPATAFTLVKNKPVLIDELFSKLKSKFSYQSEYRIAYFLMNPDSGEMVSMDVLLPELYPVILDDAGIPRISETLRLVEETEFLD